MHIESVRDRSGTAKSRTKAIKSLKDQASSFVLKGDYYIDVANVLWASLDTPVSLSCFLLHKYGEYAQLVDHRVRPQDYLEALDGLVGIRNTFRDDYLATSVLAKWPNFIHADLDPVGACKSADEAAEEHCRLTNRRLLRSRAHPREGETAYWHLIYGMQADIKRVLGDFDPTEWEESCRFGPGKASSQTGTIDYEKLISRPSSTVEFARLGAQLIAGCSPWLQALSGVAPDVFSSEEYLKEDMELHTFVMALEPGDRDRMVPKKASTHRGIRPQPGANVFAQLGIGTMIRHRLIRAGLDLNDQGPNQQLAKIGSLPGSTIVTIDLKGASGHIARVLPGILLEETPRWLFAMDCTRTRLRLPHGVEEQEHDFLVHLEDGEIPPSWLPLQSYSAMGNGFTFELETLIFWAAVRACRRQTQDSAPYRVYGDDIICGRKTSELLLPFLEFLGFPLNTRKTFLEGPFRESCGADFWNGANVRPIHFSVTAEEISEDNSNGVSILRWLQTCNAIRRLARARNHGFGCDRRLLACWRAAILRIPADLRSSLKSCWVDDQDTTLITHVEDALTNPNLRYCGGLQALVGPRLYGKRSGITPRSFLGVRAALLYRRRGDWVTCRFDRNWSRLQRVLQLNAHPQSAVQAAIGSAVGINPGVELHGRLLPSKYGLSLSAGWEVFQPVSDTTEWL